MDAVEFLARGRHGEFLALVVGRNVDAVRVGRVGNGDGVAGPQADREIRRGLHLVGHASRRILARDVVEDGVGPDLRRGEESG